MDQLDEMMRQKQLTELARNPANAKDMFISNALKSNDQSALNDHFANMRVGAIDTEITEENNRLIKELQAKLGRPLVPSDLIDTAGFNDIVLKPMNPSLGIGGQHVRGSNVIEYDQSNPSAVGHEAMHYVNGQVNSGFLSTPETSNLKVMQERFNQKGLENYKSTWANHLGGPESTFELDQLKYLSGAGPKPSSSMPDANPSNAQLYNTLSGQIMPALTPAKRVKDSAKIYTPHGY